MDGPTTARHAAGQAAGCSSEVRRPSVRLFVRLGGRSIPINLHSPPQPPHTQTVQICGGGDSRDSVGPAVRWCRSALADRGRIFRVSR